MLPFPVLWNSSTLGGGGGGGGPAFGIIQPDSGTAPTAEISEDTLTLTTSDTGVYSFIGDATTDTITLDILIAASGQTGLLHRTDWDTFNNKQPAGNYITALTGQVTASGPGSVAATIATNTVSNSNLRQSAGLSVIGRASNTTGDVADITAGTDGFVLRRSGTSLAWGLLANANIDAAAAIAGTKISPNFGSQNVSTTGTGSFASLTTSGTGGSGFLSLIPQSATPSTPASGFSLFADSSNRFSWIGANGFVRTFDGTSNTANRDYTLPDVSGTFALLAATQTLTNKTIDADSNTITNIENADIKTGAAIDAAKIANGSVSNTEFQYLDGVTSSIQTQLDARVELSGDTMTGFLILNADPTNPLGAATKQYIDGLVGLNLKWKEQIRAAVITNVNLATDVENGDSFGGVTLVTGDRVGIFGQTTAADDGIYIVQASGAPVRATDADGGTKLELATVSVTSGTQAGKVFYQNVTPLTIGTTAQVWVVLFSTAYTASGGIVLSGNNFTLLLDGSTLSQSGSGVKVADNVAVKMGGIEVFAGTDAVTVGDGAFEFRAPDSLVGYNLSRCGLSVKSASSSGTVIVQISRGRLSSPTARSYVDMLSTALTIDVNELDSSNATTPAVIDTSADDIALGDVIRVDVDQAGTGTLGLFLSPEFELP